MKKLTLPVIKGNMPKAKSLSMDNYLRFIYMNLKYIVDIKTIRKQKKLSAVNVPFVMR